jgi:hypothetical protein
MGSHQGSSRKLNGPGRRCYFQIISMGPQNIEELQIGVWRQIMIAQEQWKLIASSGVA